MGGGGGGKKNFFCDSAGVGGLKRKNEKGVLLFRFSGDRGFEQKRSKGAAMKRHDGM